MESLKILVVLAFLVLLVRRRWNVGVALILGAILLSILYDAGASSILATFIKAALDADTLKLLATVILITFLGSVLKHTEKLSQIAASLDDILQDSRITLAAVPAFIGLMPMPGGAMLSAPIVSESAERLRLTPELKTAVNYWFRHIWEYSFPLYPAVILSSTLVGLSYARIIAINGPLNLVAIVAGVFMLLWKLKSDKVKAARSASEALKVLVDSVWPIAAVIAANLLLGVDLIVSLIVVLAIILVKTRHNGFLKNAVAESEIAELPVLIVGVMFFSWSIKSTNAVQNLPTEFSGLGIPNEIILYVVPFVVGLLTGLTIAPVGITFPLLMPLINAGALNPGYFMLAYVGGFMGVMLSPVHLCLVLTAGYYRADLWKTYRTIIPLVAVVTFMAFAIAALAY